MKSIGLSEKDIELIRSVFVKHKEVEMVWLYGSRSMGNYKPASDIDLCMEGNQLNFSLLMCIENELDDLYLPYRIDLSLLKDIKNQDLRDHISRRGIVFYAREALQPI
ncbi:MAG: nucleotidyltransferase domain-containing protein [Saprospiraceae bacterium]|nr:nucleotidyltransferase domain-containing protein [Saprospiraceae bacterium]